MTIFIVPKTKTPSLLFQVMVASYQNKTIEDEKFKKWKEKEEELNKGESVAESGKIFVR